MEKIRKHPEWIVATLIFIVSLGIYLTTLAPTVSFWDCGEFIGCSYILGVPHPPGNPLYILIGRLFAMLPLTEEIAVRVNFISSLTSSLALVLLYLIMYRLTSRWEEKKDFMSQLPAHIGGIFAAFMAGFSFTVWMNAVEAEVYGLAVFIAFLISWLGLKWLDCSDTPKSKMIILLLAYLFTLGFGIHQTIIVFTPALLLLVIITNWRVLLDFKLWFWMVIIIALGWSVHLYLVIRTQVPKLGIDEADPHNWKMFWDYILRRQYRPYSFFKREASFAYQTILFLKYMSWQYFNLSYIADKFKDFSMTKVLWIFVGLSGYLGGLFHFLNEIPQNLSAKAKKRLKIEGLALISLLIVWTLLAILIASHGLTEQAIDASGYHGLFTVLSMLSMFAILYFFARLLYVSFTVSQSPKYFLYLGMLVIISTIGTVLVMNLTNKEVRERDYFWSYGYMFWAMWMGIFITQVLKWVQKNTKTVLVLVLISVMALTIPAFSIKSHHFQHSRKGEYVAHDYGLNILQSCEPNAIIFTNGDNDTFPLWFLQQVKKIRTDVIVANLSLLNTPWYIRQLKEIGCPVSYTDKQLDRIQPMMAPPDGFEHTIGGIKINIPGNKILQIKDLAVYDIIETNKWKRPVYFAVTVADLCGFDNYLSMEGLVFKLTKNKGRNNFNPQKLEENIWNVYSYRGLTKDGKPMGERADNVYKDDNAIKLVSNYAAGFSRLASYYRRKAYTEQDTIKALEYKEKMLKQFEAAYNIAPQYSPIMQGIAVSYSELGEYEKAIESWKKYLEMNPKATEAYQAIAYAYNDLGNVDKAVEYQQMYIRSNPTDANGYAQLANLYEEKGQYDRLDETYQEGIDNTGDVRLYNNWRSVYDKKKMYKDAKRVLELMLAASQDANSKAQLQKMLDDYNKKIEENK